MPRSEITAIRFRPPVVIARLGDSPTPLEAFAWAEDPRMFGAGKTVIAPRVSFEILADGSIEPYVPGSIRFRDGPSIRPVCPFLELEAKVKRGGTERFEPLTGSLLSANSIDLAQLSFEIVAANRKAERRTGDPACRFEARAIVRSDDYTWHELRAWSHSVSGVPLVFAEHPISLGALQVIRPANRSRLGVLLDTIRVRFTPGRGAVYGPPQATCSLTKGSRRAHPIVPPENRILNPAASWVNYDLSAPPYPPPRPTQTFDGESDLQRGDVSWGVVDDTCDAVISAALAGTQETFEAKARVFVGPPDYAPDRRPFYSLADELGDRNPESLKKPAAAATPAEWREAVADLFRRIAETASLIDLERLRFRHLQINAEIVTGAGVGNQEGYPAIDSASMTRADQILGHPLLSDAGASAMAGRVGGGADGAPALPLSEYAKIRHDQLSEPEVLLPFVFENFERLRPILRPPFARASELESHPRARSPLEFRDPRSPRSYLFDMRMPPYMRDADYAPLSLTRLQWDLLFRTGRADAAIETSGLFEESVFAQLSSNLRAQGLKPRKGRGRSRK